MLLMPSSFRLASSSKKIKKRRSRELLGVTYSVAVSVALPIPMLATIRGPTTFRRRERRRRM
jgi:hypothetical protein